MQLLHIWWDICLFINPLIKERGIEINSVTHFNMGHFAPRLSVVELAETQAQIFCGLFVAHELTGLRCGGCHDGSPSLVGTGAS